MPRTVETLVDRTIALFVRRFSARAALMGKLARDPAGFLVDSRYAPLRALGDEVVRRGLFGASDEATGRPIASRAIGRGHVDPGTSASAPVLDGRLSDVRGARVIGYARAQRGVSAVRILVDGEPYATIAAAQSLPDRPGERDRFDVCIDLPETRDVVELRVECAATGRPVSGSPRTVRVPRYEGSLVSVRRGYVVGFLADVVTGAPVVLDVEVSGETRVSVSVPSAPRGWPPGLGRLFTLFRATWVPRRTDEDVTLRVRGASRPLFGGPQIPDPRPSEPTAQRPASSSRSAGRVHVVVPVYAGLDTTMACIESLLASENATPVVITVVYDAGPERALLDWLSRRARDGSFDLVVNPANLGFVRTCNEAMARHPELDVLLLNSDTIVPKRFLDRLRDAALRSDDVGTVTPFSNAATICTYPILCEEHPPPDAAELERIASRCELLNRGESVDLPSGHGFCLYVKRSLLEAVGGFDEEAFGRGYGEENDLSMRGRSAGFRNVLASDAYVAHVGSVSFGAEREARVRAAMRVLAERHPGYEGDVDAFIRTDPAETQRHRVAVSLLADERRRAGRAMLFVTHHLGGGVAVHCRELAERLADEGWLVLTLASTADGTIRVDATRSTHALAYADVERALDRLPNDLRTIGIDHVHLHAWLTLDERLVAASTGLDAPYDVTLHDFFAACPRVNLVRADGTYCGAPPIDACELCVAVDGRHEALSFAAPRRAPAELGAPADVVRDHRRRGHALLAGARRIFAPSRDTAERTVAMLGPLAVHVLPHPERALPPAPSVRSADRGGRVKIAVLGGIGLHKGYLRLLEVARHASREHLPLEFVLFGTAIGAGALRRLDNVRITGSYERHELPSLVADAGCSVAAFFSVWPETYSYTLSEALALGLVPVVYDLGAPAERLRALGAGLRVPADADAATYATALLRAHDLRGRSTSQDLVVYESITSGYYGLE